MKNDRTSGTTNVNTDSGKAQNAPNTEITKREAQRFADDGGHLVESTRTPDVNQSHPSQATVGTPNPAK